MLECLACGHHNPNDVRECEACGMPLYSMAIIDPLATDTLILNDVQVKQQAQVKAGSEVFKRGMVLDIHIHGDARIIRIRPNEAILFGRSDPRLRLVPEVDLTEYGGARMGVSRVHAAMRVMGESIVLIDMRSSNGTFVNGERLEPGQPGLLRDGDEVQLGQLAMTIRFTD